MRVSLAAVLFWLSVTCCVVAQAAIIRATLRVSRAPAGGGATTLPRPRRWLEIVWVVLPAIALGLLLVSTWRAIDGPGEGSHVARPALDVFRPVP